MHHPAIRILRWNCTHCMLVRLSSAVWQPAQTTTTPFLRLPICIWISWLFTWNGCYSWNATTESVNFFSSERGGPRGCLTLLLFCFPGLDLPLNPAVVGPTKEILRRAFSPLWGQQSIRKEFILFFFPWCNELKSPFLSQALVQRNWQFLRLHFIKTPSINETNNQHYY